VGLGLGEKLQTSLVKLVKDNLSFPMADRLYSMFTFSHPPILERLAAIRDEMSKKSKSE
jgi:STE24 endopeptidase